MRKKSEQMISPAPIPFTTKTTLFFRKVISCIINKSIPKMMSNSFKVLSKESFSL